MARSLAGGGRASLAGLTGTAKALYAVLLWQAVERPLAIVTASSRQAESLFEAIETFFNLLVPQGSRPAPLLLPAFDALPGQGLAPHADIGEQRAAGLWRLASQPVPITVLPAASALVKLESADFYRQLALTLAVNDEVPLEDVVRHLESAGYERREPVEMAGEFSLRGGILDVFSPEDAKPVRIDFFGDLVESMRRFDVESQRSVLKIERATLLPLLEYPKSEALLGELRERLRGGEAAGWQLVVPLVRPRQQAVFDLLENGAVIWDEPEQCRSAAERLFQRLAQVGAPEPEAIFFTWEELAGRAGGAGRAQLEMRELSLDPSAGAIRTRPSMAFRGNVKIAMAEARTLVESGHRVAFFTASMGELERLADIFNEYGLAYQLGLEQSEHTPGYLAERAYLAGSVASIYLVRGNIRRGAIFSDSALAVIGSQDLFDASELGAAPAKSHRAAFSTDLFDLKPGDYVVHVEHGVGRFLGVREIAQGENRGDYMLIEYAAGAKLYLPLTRMDLIERFHGSGEAAPALDRMGGITWQRTKSRVKAKMRDMAEELLKLYAARKLTPGFASSSDSNWQREFEDAFEFSETPDQLTAIRDLKRDMESPEPMDRLICGDVGFGKTEVAMRAAFKILGDGKQVAVLAPTTVLAFQHFETFRRRFQQFPVRVEMLSRFRTPKEIAAVLADLAEGKLDIAIGTHRLLSKDVVFKDLGLLIVDEEQRFGVRHKERLKQMQKGVDVVSMSATPIPRTLHMSLAGLRDMSVIETPPKDRLAIHTVVTHSSPELIRSAIELELGRGG
ncbi:MAG: DEAD/DEAH box helicase, partial [Acidobacteria bacterium]|nr:DEAD/DEAH box helicase [Acidobacteriota bacterium]